MNIFLTMYLVLPCITFAGPSTNVESKYDTSGYRGSVQNKISASSHASYNFDNSKSYNNDDSNNIISSFEDIAPQSYEERKASENKKVDTPALSARVVKHDNDNILKDNNNLSTNKYSNQKTSENKKVDTPALSARVVKHDDIPAISETSQKKLPNTSSLYDIFDESDQNTNDDNTYTSLSGRTDNNINKEDTLKKQSTNTNIHTKESKKHTTEELRDKHKQVEDKNIINNSPANNTNVNVEVNKTSKEEGGKWWKRILPKSWFTHDKQAVTNKQTSLSSSIDSKNNQNAKQVENE